MFDRELIRSILLQIDQAIGKIQARTGHVDSPAILPQNSQEDDRRSSRVGVDFISII